MVKLMVVEDDKRLIKYIKDYFVTYDFEVVTIKDFDYVIEEIEAAKPDLILLDINLPVFDGFYYVRLLRKKMSIPIIILSAQSAVAEQIRGMELGADDYITKPFNADVLHAKIMAMMRRTSLVPEESETSIENLTLYHDSMRLKFDQQFVDLSKNEFRLMKKFMNSVGVVLSREELLDELWDETTFVDDNTLTVNITRVRKKLADLGMEESIVTKRGIGYVFNPKYL